MVSATIIRIMAIAIAAAVGNPVHAQTVVTTESGAVRGAVEGDVVSWKGIPFAAPPTGALRWRAPQPASKWRAERDATQYGSDCMQVPFPSDAAPLGTPPAEDCLYLNAWRPASGAKKLPVVVWIYGGGFVNGGSSPPTYTGAELARQGVVFVSFNYRVGRFGTFAHPQLTRADADKGLLGNYGHLDQIAALKWVKRNVAAFGGDPANITVIGESAGGMSVHTLLTTPLAQELFNRAVIMSGGAGSGMDRGDLAQAEKIGLAFAATKDIAPEDPSALAKLRALSAEQVTDSLNMATMRPATGPQTYKGPFPDGRISVDAASAYARGAFARVPVMIGATSDDIGGPTGVMIAGARTAAALIGSAGVPVYEYRFSYVAQSINRDGAAHATDIPFFLDTAAIKYGDATTPRDRAMARIISTYIVNFAKRGDPNGDGLPTWPRSSGKTDRLMNFTAAGTAALETDPFAVAQAK